MAYACLIAFPALGQLVTDRAAIPRTEGKPPVVFVNGYQGGCRGPTFSGTFGAADQVMQRDGRVSLFFDNCSAGGNDTPIEELGNALGRFIDGMKYVDGSAVPQVDVVAHSMGGLIVRSYLAGKQVADGVFTPPAVVKVRKLVFLGTPHFGTPVVELSGNNKQIEQLAPASNFVFDLATWNQGQEDLRGVDFVSVLGNAGSIQLQGLPSGFHDSTVPLMSGSTDFTPVVDRNRILPYCHTSGIAGLACNGGALRLADIPNDQHDSARIILSFLNGTEQWRSIGQSLLENQFLRDNAGLAVRWRDANDRVVLISTAGIRAQGSTGQFENLDKRGGAAAYDELLRVAPYEIRLTLGDTAINTNFEPVRGAFRALTLKLGPTTAAVAPVFRPVYPRAVAPGMFVSLYGALASTTATAPGLPYPTTLGDTQVLLGTTALPLHYVSPQQINSVLPEDISGLIKLTVKTPAGQHTINVLTEPAVPSLFDTAVIAATGALVNAAAPAKAGDYLSIYLTGLGATERRADGLDWARQQPEVTIGNQACALLYAGRSPGYVGLDQINCRIPENAAPGDLSLTVKSGSRISNAIAVPVR